MLPAKVVCPSNIGFLEPGPFEIGFQVVLQAKKHRVGEHAATRLKVGIDSCRLRRILLPVRKFVAVSSQQEVHGLFPPSAVLLKTARWRRARRKAGVYAKRPARRSRTCDSGETISILGCHHQVGSHRTYSEPETPSS